MKKVIPQKRKVAIEKMSVGNGEARIENREKVTIKSQEKVKSAVDQDDVVGQMRNVQNVPKTVTRATRDAAKNDAAKRNGIAGAKNAVAKRNAVQSDDTIDRQSTQHTIVIPIIHHNIEIVHYHQCLHADHEPHQILRHRIQRNSMNFVAVALVVALRMLKNQ